MIWASALVAQAPNFGKIMGIGIGYSQNGQTAKVMFLEEDNRYHHWLDVWNLHGKNSMVNYIMEPSYIVVWGHGQVLTEVLDSKCMPPSPPMLKDNDYWVATMKQNKFEFTVLSGDDQKAVKNLLANLQAASSQTRAGGLLDTPNRPSLWEQNIISMFQKGKRNWIHAEWIQPLTVCVRQLK